MFQNIILFIIIISSSSSSSIIALPSSPQSHQQRHHKKTTIGRTEIDKNQNRKTRKTKSCKRTTHFTLHFQGRRGTLWLEPVQSRTSFERNCGLHQSEKGTCTNSSSTTVSTIQTTSISLSVATPPTATTTIAPRMT